MQLRLAALLAVALVAGGCGGGDDETSSQSVPGCTAVEAPEPREPETREAPTAELDPNVKHTAVVRTNCGEFTITLAPDRSPNAAASFAALAEDGYYDDTMFHRIVPEFVIQGGDPTATGTGGPGYTTVDTPAKDTQYTLGTVAMAKTAAEPASNSRRVSMETSRDYFFELLAIIEGRAAPSIGRQSLSATGMDYKFQRDAA